MIANGAKGTPPFRSVIAEYPWWQPFLDDQAQQQQYSNVLSLAGCHDLSCLRSLSSSALQDVALQSFVTAYNRSEYGFGDFYYGPVVDGEFLRELPDQAFKAGRFYDVPLLLDHDAFEGVRYTNTSITTQGQATANARLLFPRAGPAFFSRLYQLYPASAYNSSFFQAQAWFGDFIINCELLCYCLTRRSNVFCGIRCYRPQ